ncbi:MAG: hypothetical protein RTU30_12985 [Candidatus Thorarchaeota archaeon]
MRVRNEDGVVPYPLAILRGRLRLSGCTVAVASVILHNVIQNLSPVEGHPLEEELVRKVRQDLVNFDDGRGLRTYRFDVLTEYESLRRSNPDIQPVVLVIEGASATGKSMVVLELMAILGVTRFVSTDSIRQILRATSSEQEQPELFCHTYQAHKHRQSGPENLSPVVRGFIAQYELLEPSLKETTSRIVDEGAEAIIEGVHLIPGMFNELSESITEIVLNPDSETHRAMFTSKSSAAGLKSVSDKHEVRLREFEATREIQDYLVSKAQENSVLVMNLIDYDQAVEAICDHIFQRVKELIEEARLKQNM